MQLTKKACDNKYQFMANIMSPTTSTHMCSGVLFAKDLVLVPASCVSKKSTRSEPFPIVRVGRYALNGLDGEDVVEVGRCQSTPNGRD